MTLEEKSQFIREELYHELRCLLGATTVWKIFSNTEKGFDVVVAQDSVLIHARILFEFFDSRGENKSTLRVDKFGVHDYASQVYNQWKVPINNHLMHLDMRRLTPSNVKKKKGHLNEQLEELTKEILRLWARFESDPSAIDFREVLTEARLRAIEDAKNDAAGRIDPLFT
jgi:hypothetical protein